MRSGAGYRPASDVFVQDQTTEAIDLYICQNKGTTNPTVALDVDDRTVTVASVTGAAIGDCIDFKEGNRFFQSIVSGITGNVIDFASPLDFAFTTAAYVCFGEWDLAQANGSVTPVIYCMAPPPTAVYDIYGILVTIVDNAVMDETTFGGITALTNGIVGRVEDGYNKNLFLITNNSGFREYGFQTAYPEKVPAGSYAFWGDKLFKVKNGVALRISGSTNDKIEVIIQDDLTALTKFSITVHGHLVE